ncbi:HD domain-containing protein [Virgibacillus proomii]|uniref:HD domain-containing protein n=1 Tax=Virgibacillus proomii TaxID=84407 RepID=UPI00209CDF63|nr:HD domain-containing protein [Virgibacillus proomii]
MINPQKEDVILKTKQFVFQELNGDASDHDWWHIVRVAKMAKTIALKEGADLFICEIAALLHDIADEKLNKSAEKGL